MRCNFMTRAGTFIGEWEVPVRDGQRPEIVKIGSRLFRHYKGASILSLPEYREIAGDFVEIDVHAMA